MSELDHVPYGDQNAFINRLYQLTQELESVACKINPDYESMEEDGSYGRISAADLNGEIKTTVDFEAERMREQLGGNTFDFKFAGAPIRTVT